MRKEMLKLIKAIIFMLITVACYRCSSPPAKTHPDRRPVKSASKNIVVPLVVNQPVNHGFYPITNGAIRDTYTFSSCRLYGNADTSSAVMRTLDAFTPVICLEKRERDYADTIREAGKPPYVSWKLDVMYRIKVGHDTGYIRGENIAFQTLGDTAVHALYLFASNYRQKNASKQFLIKKVSWPGKKLMASIETEDLPATGMEVYLTGGGALSNVTRLVKVIANADYCGGYQTGVCFADLGDRFIKMPQNNSLYDDGGGVDNTEVFFPQQDADGQWALKLDTLGQHFDTLRTLSVPRLDFPPNELIGETHLEGAYAMDKDNEMIPLKSGGYKMETPLTLTTRFYHWDGRTLTKLPWKSKVGVKK